MADQQKIIPAFSSSGGAAGASRNPAEPDIPSAVLWIDRFWKCGVILALYVYLFRDEMIRLGRLWMTPRESHGLLIPLFSLYFIYQDRSRLGKIVGRPCAWGLLAMGLAVAGYLVTVFKGFYYPRQLMMLFMIAAIVLFLGGWAVLRRLWLPIGYLLFAMPLPEGIYYNITLPLRQLASTVAAMILNVMPDVSCESAGVVILGAHHDVPFKLNVAEACSGMRLLMTFVALGVAMA
jgi:exosortase